MAMGKFYLVCSFCVFTLLPTIAKCEFDPEKPFASGYQIVFDDEFTSLSTIDVKDTRQPGFNWYTGHFFGYPSLPSDAFNVTENQLILSWSKCSNMGLCTAVPAKNKNGFVGRAWGGGAYFEARFKFNPQQVDTKKGWPSFWSMAIEHLSPRGKDQWPGQPKDFRHFIEDDFFEYDTASPWNANNYGAALHDCYGIYNQTCPHGFCDISNKNNFKLQVPQGTDFNQFHTYSQLWVPSIGGKKGYLNNYFDGQLLSQVTWIDSGIGAPPLTGNSIFSIFDQDHLAIILGTGDQQPVTFNRIMVWQLPGQGTCVGDFVALSH